MTWVVWGVAAALLTVTLWQRLDDPPLWDAAWSTSAGAAELSRNGFDYGAVLSAAPFDEGGPGTHAASLLTPLLGVFFVLFGSPGGLIAGHLMMIVIGSGLVAATFSLARRYVRPALALASAALIMVFPLIVQQVADPYIELPLALFAVLTVISCLDGRRGRAAGFAALAVWFKPTGLMLVPLLAIMGVQGEARRWAKNASAVLLATIPIAFHLIGRSAVTHTGAEPSLDTTLVLLRNALVVLGATTDVLLIAALFVVAAVRQYRDDPELVKAAMIVTVGFFGILVFTMVFSQAVTILPRYYVALLPLWIVVVVVHLEKAHSWRIALGFLSTLAVFSVFNWSGAFYPLADHPQPVMAERTPGGAREYLELEVAGTRALAQVADSVDVVVVGQAMHFRFQYPQLGFLDDRPENFTSARNLDGSVPESFAWIHEPHISSDTVTPVDIAGDRGWAIERVPVWDGRWISQLVIARSDP